MRTLFFRVLPLALAAACTATAPGADGGALTVVDVGPADVAAGVSLDLTGDATVYRLIDLHGQDLRLATIVTEEETLDLGSYLSAFPEGLEALDGELMLGSPAALRGYRGVGTGEEVGADSQALAASQQRRPGGAGSLGFTCNPWFCTCEGTADCSDMWDSGVCRGAGYCDDTGYPESCVCTRSLVVSGTLARPATQLDANP